MAKTVLGVFSSVAQAEKAPSDLDSKGVSRSEISVIAKEIAARREGPEVVKTGRAGSHEPGPVRWYHDRWSHGRDLDRPYLL